MSSIELTRSHSILAAVEPRMDSVSTKDGGPGDLDTPDSPTDGELSGQMAKVSISHDGDYAYAVCLAAEEAMEGDVGGEATPRGWGGGLGRN